ncbi:solute carrier family 44 protein member 2, putative [Ichthyophthirius multifiliis]|uniref:Choline transporter-like protein n=1 Tax=Ichthyophthirius multifiliis TaxID=5932 RepID=G0QLC8_ICHMU|nr:solute carrier family 44 protein member 2, putative [Ichthyophthirius multifiliis]EGR33974.1 solute carrier family 44 protein member 2, putative [Ichthyophthirius multifiliis]|eukprot:XP_004039278.1 solute carrier family 44 protein member 2, putative [Ichthyophthirius multifiliis]
MTSQISQKSYKYKENDPQYIGEKQNLDRNLIHGPKQNRMPTNCLCAIIYIAFLSGIIVAAIFAFKEGSPYKYSYPSDSDGNICGIDQGYKDYKYVLLLDEGMKNSVCVEECTKEVKLNGKYAAIKCKANSKIKTNTLGECLVSENNMVKSKKYVNACVSLQKENELQKILQPQEDFQKNLSDFQKSWPIMLFSLCVSLILSYIYIGFMKKYSTCLTWSCILIIISSFFVFGGLCVTDKYKDVLLKQNQNQKQMQLIGIASIFLGSICLLYIICKCNRIRMGVALLGCSSNFISDVCSILILPLILWIIYVLILVFLGTACVWAYGIGKYTKDQGPYESYEYSVNRNIYLIFIFGFVWISEFMANYAYFIISSCTSIWYFKRNQQNQLEGNIKSSLKFGFYHFGSIAYCSLILPIFSILGVLFSLFYKCGKKFQKKKQEKEIVQSQQDRQFEEKSKDISDNCKNCCICCSDYYEAKIRFVQKSGIIEMAFAGKDFIKSCYDSYYLQKRNSQYYSSLLGLSQLMLLLGKLFIACTSTFICYIILSDHIQYKNDLYSPFLPTICVAYASFTIGNIFVSVFSSSSDTILQIYCVDEELHNEIKEKSTNVPPQLIQFLENFGIQQKGEAKT